MQYTYTDNPETQYDWSEVADKSRIEPIMASYICSKIPDDRGNPYMEALPLPPTDTEIVQASTIIPSGLAIHDTDSRVDILNKVSLLRTIRFPLPFIRDVNEAFYLAIQMSYRNRRVFYDKKQNISYTAASKKEITHQLYRGDLGSGTDPGFHLIGVSGSGKSSAWKIVLARYPQYIRHSREDGQSYFPQIPYLMVTCAPNSNFSAIFAGIGRAIDRAVGNLRTEDSYEMEVINAGGLAKQAAKVIRLIDIFGVGAIILDEIQLIDFGSSKSNTFENFLTMANATKVAIIAVGTEDAYNKMFERLRNGRRLGEEIQASTYCEKPKFFAVLCRSLFSQGMFGPEVKLTQDLLKELQNCTGGIVDQLISLFSFMVLDYHAKKTHPAVTPQFVRETAYKHFPGIQQLLNDINNPLNDARRQALVTSGYDQLDKMLKSEKQKEFEEALENGGLDAAVESETRKGKICESIEMVTDDYNHTSIMNMIDIVLKTKSGSQTNDKELTRKVLSRLKSGKTDRRPNGHKAKNEMDEKHSKLQNYLNLDRFSNNSES